MFFTIKIKDFIICLVLVTLVFTTGVFAVEKKPKNSIDVPIFMYHSILKHSAKNRYIVKPDGLEEDLKYITKNGYTTITTSDLIEYVYNNKPLPKNPVILTFDDGYYNNYVYAYPLMKKYNCKMVLSVVGKYTDDFSKTGEENANYSHIVWDKLKEMSDSGYVEILNHTYDMHSFGNGRNGCKKRYGETKEQYEYVLTGDVGKLQNRIKEHIGIIPICFTYPYGAVSDNSLDIIKNMGFKASLSCLEGMNYITRDKNCLYLLKRYIRTPDRSVSDILK